MASVLPCGCKMNTLATYDQERIQELLGEGNSIIVDNPDQEEIALFYLDEQNRNIRTIAMSDWTTPNIATEILNYENTMKRTFPFYHLKKHTFSFVKVKIKFNQDRVVLECETHAHAAS